MDLRLDVVAEPGRTAVRISGRLTAVAARELERVCREASGTLLLDVTHVVSGDDGGFATLRRLATGGAQLVGVSPYLALLLEGDRAPGAHRAGEVGQGDD
jgi:hypothetical protein